MAALTLLPQRLQRLAATAGGQPFLTHYGADAARTELSVASFANWVDKTANLLDDLGIDADADVALPVLVERPPHWMGLVWPFAVWRVGGGVRLATRPDASGADLAVLGPDAPTPVGRVTVACSLHAWGLPLADLPAGVLDFASEALAQPDHCAAPPPEPDRAAWADAHGVRTHAALAALEPLAGRACVAGPSAWEAVALLAGAVLGGGSVVLVEPGAADVARVAASERAVVREFGTPTRPEGSR